MFRSRADESRLQTGTFFNLVTVTLKPLLASIVTAACLQYANPWLSEFYALTELTIDNERYATLLATVAATGGVLIGLYYAATTAIQGAIYSKVPNNIRDLLNQDRVGNVYMRFLSFLTFSSIIFLGLKAGGFTANSLAGALLLLGAGVSVIAFVTLGARAFNLFDPTTLSGEVVYQIQDAYLRTRPGAYRWDDPSFQNYAHMKARAALDTAKTLAEIVSKEGQLKGQPFVTLCAQLLLMLRQYERQKKHLPSDSRWFQRKYSHPDWYRTGDSETSMAFQSSGRLNPKEVSDPQWIESDVLPIAFLCFRTNAEAGRHDLVSSIATQFHRYAQTLAAEHNVKAAFGLLNELTSKCSDLIFARKADDKALEPIEQLALADAITAIPTSIFLSYAEVAKVSGRQLIESSIGQIGWSSKIEIYNVGLARHLLPQLEWLFPRVDFEIKTEGFRTSPNWYLSELAIQPHLENLKIALTELITEAQTLFDVWYKATDSGNLIWVRANILTRESEYWSKVEYQFHIFKSLVEELNSDRRIDGLPWPSIDLEALEKSIQERKKFLLKRMADDVVSLIAVERPETYPDFAGQFLHTVGESLLSAFINSDIDLIKEVFPHFFIASFMQHDRLGANYDPADWRTSIAIKVAVAPILDLMSLSGYGVLMAEFHGNPALAAPIRTIWNKIIDKQKSEGKDLLMFLAAAISMTETAFELAHRSIIRTSWGQEVAHELRNLPRRPVVTGGTFISTHTVAVHSSPLVRVMAGDRMGSLFDGIDIFIEEIVRKRPDGKSVEFGPRHDLGDSLDREIKRSGRDEDEDE